MPDSGTSTTPAVDIAEDDIPVTWQRIAPAATAITPAVPIIRGTYEAVAPLVLGLRGRRCFDMWLRDPDDPGQLKRRGACGLKGAVLAGRGKNSLNSRCLRAEPVSSELIA